jgi:uncharacterized protein YuzE
MKITYDTEADAAYIYFRDRGPVQVTTVHVTEDVAVDLGPGEQVVGIEVLDASEHLGFSRDRPEIEVENMRVAG